MLAESFAEITNNMSEPHFLLAQDGCIIYANQAARKRFSMPLNDSDALNLDTLITDEADKIRRVLQMWSRSKSPLPASVTFKRAGDEPANYMCKGNNVRPSVNGEDALIMMQCTDKRQSTAAFVTLNEKIDQLKREIMQRDKAEKEIRRLNRDLEQRVKERTAELQLANTEISRSFEELQSAQEELVRTERLASLGSMVAGVAHEINTPVGVSVTAVSYLKDKVSQYRNLYQEDTLTREDFESFIDLAAESSDIILTNLSRAADLVRSFKQLAVDQTSNEYRHINMKVYLEELLLSLQPYFKHTSHHIEVECPHDIDFDSLPGAIAQVINNLISNSFIHGFDGIEQGLIRIVISRDDDNVLIHYSDDGRGISKDNLGRIFDPFFTTRRNEGGSGLGMNIVYNLVTGKLGGSICADGEEQQGLHCYISIPAVPVAQQD